MHISLTFDNYHKLPDNEKSDLGNPLLETVSKYWFPIQSRFQGTALSLYNKSEHGTTARMHLALLLSSLLDLIAVTSKLCDGFIADRFQSSIFPHMSKLFEALIYRVNDVNNNPSKKLSKEDSIILTSLLHCIATTFSTNGLQLASLVPIVGSIILPFLALNENIGDIALETMKTLIEIDSDCLWRALLNASGQGIPPRPLLPMEHRNNCSKPPKVTQSRLSERSLKLIEFANTLPEPNILY